MLQVLDGAALATICGGFDKLTEGISMAVDKLPEGEQVREFFKCLDDARGDVDSVLKSQSPWLQISAYYSDNAKKKLLGELTAARDKARVAFKKCVE
jgi:hypothetical protein